MLSFRGSNRESLSLCTREVVLFTAKKCQNRKHLRGAADGSVRPRWWMVRDDFLCYSGNACCIQKRVRGATTQNTTEG